MKPLLIATLLSCAAFAQTTTTTSQTCPISLANVSLSSNQIRAELKNESKLAIAEFQPEIDSVIEAHHPRQQKIDAAQKEIRQALDVGEKRLQTFVVKIKFATQEKARVWIKTVKFQDGSVWNDNGSHSCASAWLSAEAAKATAAPSK